MEKRNHVIIGGDTFVWPALATTVAITLKPGRKRENLAKVYLLAMDVPVAGAYISNYDSEDSDLISGSANGAPVTLFAANSVLNTMEFPPPDPSVPHVLTLTAGTAPGVDTAISAALVPKTVAEQARIAAAQRRARRKRKPVPRKVKRAIRKVARRRNPRRRGFVRRFGGGLKSFGRGLFSRMPFVRGEMGDAVSQLGQEAVEDLIEQQESDILEAVGEYLGDVVDDMSEQELVELGQSMFEDDDDDELGDAVSQFGD